MKYIAPLVSVCLIALLHTPAVAAERGEDLLTAWQAGILKDFRENRNKRSRKRVVRSMEQSSRRCVEPGDSVSVERSLNGCLQALVLARGIGHPDADRRLDDLANRISATKRVPDFGTIGAATATHIARRIGPTATEQAEALQRHALDRAMATHGTTHLLVAEPLADLARSRLVAGDLTQASSLLGRAKAIAGRTEPLATRIQMETVRLRLASPQPVAALAPLDQLLDVQDTHITRHLLVGTPADRQALLEPLYTTTHQAVSTHLRILHGNPRAADLALRTLLRRKGRLIEAEYDALHAVRRGADEEGLKIIDALAQAASSLSEGTDSDATRTATEREVERLQGELAARSELFREQVAETTVSDVQAALAKGQALLEIAVFRPWDPIAHTFGAHRYAAYVVRPDGPVEGVDLGPATTIDDGVRRLRADLMAQEPAEASSETLATAVLGPLTQMLQGAEQVVVSPDGLLNLVPFDVLFAATSGGDAPAISYVTTGRDLLQLGMWKGKASKAAIFYGVDFGGSGPHSPLPGTEAEGTQLARTFPDALAIHGADATEERFKELVRPTFLHAATHGFFQTQREPALFAPKAQRGLEVLAGPVEPDEPVPEDWEGPSANPALDSGIVLAGANAPAPGRLNGILTAAELSNVDLRSTRIAVLSACETGVGSVRNGDGVQGLRRALVLSGSHAQVLSLWKVDDDATQFLMTQMYEGLASGGTVLDALRRAKAETAKRTEWRHPYFWAAFTLSGAWSTTLDP